MSALVKLGTKLPGEPSINGLDCLKAELVAHQEDGAILVMAVLDVSDVRIPTGADPVPTMRVRKIEALGYVGDTAIADLPPVPAVLQQAYLARSEARQGMQPLPFDALDSDDTFEVI